MKRIAIFVLAVSIALVLMGALVNSPPAAFPP
jgi:hypothetical protein